MADAYNPNQTQSPSTNPGDNLLSVRASPDDFGAQVGQATQKLGGTLEQAGKQQIDIGIQRQGMLNDASIAEAEAQGNTQLGQIDGEYKSLKGRAAVDALDTYQNKVRQVRQNILATLPNDAAKRGFNQVFSRAEGYTLREYGGYAATQVKEADNQATQALQEQTIDSFARLGVAEDPQQLGFALGTLRDTAQHLTINQGWKPDDKEWDTVFNKYYDAVKGPAFVNATKTLADKDPIQADKFLEDNKDVIPSVTYAQLKTSLLPQVRGVQARTGASEAIKWADDAYTNSITSKQDLPSINPNKYEGRLINKDDPKQLNDLTDKFIKQESGGSTVTNLGQIQPDTWKKFANTDQDINDPIDNRNVTSKILSHYSQEYKGDLGRIATAYFSGEGNVAPAGSANPWISDKQDSNGKSVSSYVSDITSGHAAENEKDSSVFRTKAEFYELHQSDIDQKARGWAQMNYPNDIRMQDDTVQRTQQYYSGVIREENSKINANKEAVRRYIFGEGQNGQKVTSLAQLDNAPLEIRDGWQHLQSSDYLASEGIKKIIDTNSKAKTPQLTYGTDFWKHFEDMASRIGTDNPPKASDYWNYSGPNRNSPLTNTGLDALNKELTFANTPEGAAFMHSEKAYFEKLRTGIMGSVTSNNAIGNNIFQRAMIQALPKIQAGRSAGKSAGDLFDEDGSDYIGGAKTYDSRTLEQQMKDAATIQSPTTMDQMIGATGSTKTFTPETFDKIQDPKQGIDSIKQSLKGKKLTPEEYDTVAAYLLKRKWAETALPSVPNAQ